MLQCSEMEQTLLARSKRSQSDRLDVLSVIMILCNVHLFVNAGFEKFLLNNQSTSIFTVENLILILAKLTPFWI